MVPLKPAVNTIVKQTEHKNSPAISVDLITWQGRLYGWRLKAQTIFWAMDLEDIFNFCVFIKSKISAVNSSAFLMRLSRQNSEIISTEGSFSSVLGFSSAQIVKLRWDEFEKSKEPYNRTSTYRLPCSQNTEIIIIFIAIVNQHAMWALLLNKSFCTIIALKQYNK
jgi:hypothetical protein